MESKRHREGKGFRDFYSEYPSKESRAGHSYNISEKHKMSESRGMKRAMDKKYPGSHPQHGMHKPHERK